MIQLRFVAIDKQAYADLPAPLRRLTNEQAAIVAMLQDERLYQPEDHDTSCPLLRQQV